MLSDGRVVGMVTDTTESESASSAPKAEVIVSYVNGIIPDLIRITGNAPKSAFCLALRTVVDSSRNGFLEIAGAPSIIYRSPSDKIFKAKILPLGAQDGEVIPGNRVTYTLLERRPEKDSVEKEFSAVVSKIKACWPNWEEKDTSDSIYRSHIFKTDQESTIVSVHFNETKGNDLFFSTHRLSFAVSTFYFDHV